MSHYAKVENGIVTNVIVAEPEFFATFIDSSPGEWIQTSYNTRGGAHTQGRTPLRKNFAGKGYTYDPIKDAFIPPQPYPSWTLNETTCQWVPPFPCPDNEFGYMWNEEEHIWEQVTE